MIEILILAAIAVFVLSRLYVALGKDDGPTDRRPNRPVAGPDRKPGGNVVKMPGPTERNDAPVFTGPGAAGLEAIYKADNSFNTRDFKLGARAAYKMIVDAYARGDKDMLRPLLDDDVYDAWSEAIDERADKGIEPFELLRMRKIEIEDADLTGGVARVMVRYEAELGDGETTRSAKEIWTFMRTIASSDPNWVLDDVEVAD